MAKQNILSKLSKKRHLPVEKGAHARFIRLLRASGDDEGGVSAMSAMCVSGGPQQSREPEVSLPTSSRTSQDSGNTRKRTRTGAMIPTFSYDSFPFKRSDYYEGSKVIVQNKNEKVKSWWIALLGKALGRTRNAFVARKHLYTTLGIFAILFFLSVSPVPISTVQAEIGTSFSPAPIFLFDPALGIPDELFVSEDGTGPNITSTTAVFLDPQTIKVQWITDVPANSVVEYATRAQYLAASSSYNYPFTGFVENPAYTTAHSITLSNLIPNETYYYRISSANASSTESQSIVYSITPPPTVPISATSIQILDGKAFMTFTGVPGKSYNIEAKNDLYGAWTVIATRTAKEEGGFFSGTFWFIDLDTALYPSRYYRAVPATPSTVIAVSPAPGTTLGTYATFSWNAVANATEYRAYFGSSPGAGDIYSASTTLNTNATVQNIPTDGRTLYLRIGYKVRSVWIYRDFTYKAFTPPVAPPSVEVTLQSSAVGGNVTTSIPFVCGTNSDNYGSYRTCTTSVAPGTPITFTATPNTGYAWNGFSGFSGGADCPTFSTTCTVTTADIQGTVFAYFQQVISAPKMGPFSADPSTVNQGQTTGLSWSVLPTSAYFCNLSGDGPTKRVQLRASYYETLPLATTTRFTLACAGLNATSSKSAMVTVAIPLARPTAAEQTVTTAPPTQTISPSLSTTSLTCSPASKKIFTNGWAVQATLTATGGTGTYAWSIPGGRPSAVRAGNRSSVTIRFRAPSSTPYVATVTSGSETASCRVYVLSGKLSSAGESQTGNVLDALGRFFAGLFGST